MEIRLIKIKVVKSDFIKKEYNEDRHDFLLSEKLERLHGVTQHACGHNAAEKDQILKKRENKAAAATDGQKKSLEKMVRQKSPRLWAR